MKVTAKSLAKKLGLSETAVSMALNGKPGVSTETRKKVMEAAEAAGYDFERIAGKSSSKGTIYFISYRSSNAILSYSPIFNELWEGVQSVCLKRGYPIRMLQVYGRTDDINRVLEELRAADCAGIALIGTELSREVLERFLSLKVPITLLDSLFEDAACDCVLINNFQGAYVAVNHLISIYREQPGYLKSSYSIPNFEERSRGFNRALLDNGMSKSRCIVHELSPSIEDAMADMLEIIDRGDALARCYFADNDIIAIGCLKAFRLRGFRIPEDVAIMGFDNIPEARIVEPALTTMDVNRFFLGRVAAKNLLDQIESREVNHVKIEVAAGLTRRFSV